MYIDKGNYKWKYLTKERRVPHGWPSFKDRKWKFSYFLNFKICTLLITSYPREIIETIHVNWTSHSFSFFTLSLLSFSQSYFSIALFSWKSTNPMPQTLVPSFLSNTTSRWKNTELHMVKSTDLTKPTFRQKPSFQVDSK